MPAGPARARPAPRSSSLPWRRAVKTAIALAGAGRLETDGEEDHALAGVSRARFRTASSGAVDHAHVRAAAAQREQVGRVSPARAACRRRRWKIDVLPRGDGVGRGSIISSEVTPTGQPGPCTSSTDSGDHAVDAVADDGMRLPPAHFHQHPRLRRQGGDAAGEAFGQRAVPIFVEVTSWRLLRLGRIGGELREQVPAPARWRRPGQASSLSTLEMAKPDGGPGRTRPGPMSGMQARQTSRVMPPNWTLPTFRPCSSRISRTSPGNARGTSLPPSAARERHAPPPPVQRHAAVVGRHTAMGRGPRKPSCSRRRLADSLSSRFWKQAAGERGPSPRPIGRARIRQPAPIAIAIVRWNRAATSPAGVHFASSAPIRPRTAGRRSTANGSPRSILEWIRAAFSGRPRSLPARRRLVLRT